MDAGPALISSGKDAAEQSEWMEFCLIASISIMREKMR
jgi:hypothetical protein